MIKTKNLQGAQAVTANRLRDGAVVFLAADGSWSTDIAECGVADDADSATARLALGIQAVQAQIVVAPYLIEIAREGGRVVPLTHREKIRAFGPSVPLAR